MGIICIKHSTIMLFFYTFTPKFNTIGMVWYETLVYIVGGSGFIGGLYSIYTAKVQKKKIQVEVTQLLNDEWENLFNKLKEDTNTKIVNFESKIVKMEMKNEIQSRAINQFLKCMFVQKGNGCPVATFMETADDVLQKNLTSEQISILNGRNI